MAEKEGMEKKWKTRSKKENRSIKQKPVAGKARRIPNARRLHASLMQHA